MKRVPNIIIFLFVHIFFQCSFNYILIRLYHLAYYLRNTLSRFFDSCKILRIIIARIQVVTFREIFATCIIRGIYTTSRFFLLKIYFNGWEFFFDNISYSFLLTPSCGLTDSENIIIQFIISDFATTSILFPVTS